MEDRFWVRITSQDNYAAKKLVLFWEEKERKGQPIIPTKAVELLTSSTQNLLLHACQMLRM